MSEESTVTTLNYSSPIASAVIDPSYFKKREKTHIVGLEDGRMIVTRRGWLGRRDTVAHQASGRIEALAWMGSLVAVADEAGVKIQNIETGERLAHVDRPKGAHSKLYDLGEIPCCLTFESERSLLVGWGDCLMNLNMEETSRASCRWAWALDVVCSGVVPLDRTHVGVLGAVEDGGVELQVIARSDGTIKSCDYLPLQERGDPPPAVGYCLTSTYSVSRTSRNDEIGERQERGEVLLPSELGGEEEFERFDIMEGLYDDENDDDDEKDENDNGHPPLDFSASTTVPPKPPVISVISPCDTIIVRPRDFDDKVDYARNEGDIDKCLARALKHRRLLRRNLVTNVIEEFMVNKLKLNSSESVKRAASLAPMLLGADRELWEKYIYAFSKTPIGLESFWLAVPVRDPRLPSSLYEMILERMLVLCEAIAPDLEAHFLQALRAWGNTKALRDHLEIRDDEAGRKHLANRFTQTAAGYLQQNDAAAQFLQPSLSLPSSTPQRPHSLDSFSQKSESHDSLYSVVSVKQRVAARNPLTRLTTLAMAELSRQVSDLDAALDLYLKIGRDFSSPVDDQALSSVMNDKLIVESSLHDFVVGFIETNELVKQLFDAPDGVTSLCRLIGLPQAARFLVDHSTTASIAKVFKHFQPSPKLQLWFLHLVFVHKTELYMDPGMSHELRQRHVELLVDYQVSYVKKDRHKWSISGDKQSVESFGKFESPLMVLLRVLLANSIGLKSDIRNLLASKVTKSGAYVLPRELAYVLQKTGASREEAFECVQLYLVNMGSIELAVLFAEDSAETVREGLWEEIVTFSIKHERLGALLKAANLVRADLSVLVHQIPNNAVIEGLKDTLLEAIKEFKTKVDLHIAAKGIVEAEESALKEELAGVSRVGCRGERVTVASLPPSQTPQSKPKKRATGMLGRSRVSKFMSRNR